MQHVIQTGKRAFSAAVAAATIAFSVGAGALMAPTSASAASAGDLIRGTSLSTVYFYGYDGMRYAFPNEKTFMTWFANFSTVKTISDSALSDIGLGGNVVVRPGTTWIKITSVDKVYAVSTDGMIHWIESEEVATDLAGSNWNTNIVDVPDVFFADYTVGSSLMEATAFDGALYSSGGKTYLAWDGEMREVSAAGMSSNNLMSKYVLDGGNIDDSGLDAGAMITSSIAPLVDASQTWSGADEEPAVGGDLTLSPSTSMPAGVQVPKGANGVEVLSFNVRAGSEDAELDSLVVSLTGVGAVSNISDIYLYEGNMRLTEARTINSATRAVTFSGLNLNVDAGETRSLNVRVTLSGSAQASDSFGFRIASAADAEGSGDVGGSFPIASNIFTIATQSAGTVTVAKTGSIANPSVGQQDADIAKFRIEAGTEPVDVEAITLDIDDAQDHSDFRLYQNNDLLAYGEWVEGDSVLFDLSSEAWFIDNGDNDTFTVTADVGGQNADTLRVAIDNAIDVVAVGRDYGFGQQITMTSYDETGSACSSSAEDCSYSTIQGGDVTFVFNGPTAGDLKVDGTNQVLLEFSVTSSNEINIKDIDFILYADDDGDNTAFDATEGGNDDDDSGLFNGDNGGTSGGDTNSLQDIEVVNADTGSVILSAKNYAGTNDSSVTLEYTEDFTVEAGETLNLALVADVDEGVASGTEFGATLDMSGLTIEDIGGDSLTLGTEIVPSSDLVGFNQEATDASLAVSLASTPGDVTTVQNADNVHVQSFNFTAGEASDVVVTEIDLSAYGDSAAGLDSFTAGGEAGAQVEEFIESCSLYEGSVLVAGPESPDSDGTNITFDNMMWTVEADSVATLLVRCNLANPSDTDADGFAFDLADVSEDIIAEDGSEDGGGDTVTATGDAVNGGTTPTNIVTINPSGSLTSSVSSGTPAADFVLAGSSMNHVASFRFDASNEAFRVETLTFSEEQAEDDTGSANSTAYANNISTVTIEYPKADGTTGTKTVAMSGNEARFAGLDMEVPVGTQKTVVVKATLPVTDRDAGGNATSNEKIRLGLFVDASGNDNFRAVGLASGVTYTDTDADGAGTDWTALGDDASDGVKTFIVRETKPTVTLASGSPSGSTAPGRQEALRFNVAASANEDVALSQIIFKLTSTDAGASDWNLCDTDADGVAITASDFDLYNFTLDGTSQTLEDQNSGTWTIHGASGAACGTTADGDVSFGKLTMSTAEIIPAGSTYQFQLWFDSTGASSTDDDVIRFDIPTDPIVSTFLVADADGLAEDNLAATDTSISVENSADYEVGDILCMDTDNNNTCASTEERMLVTADNGSGTLTVVRGYLGSAPDTANANDTDDSIHRVPTAFLWQDDGTSSVSESAEEYWGAYLVDNLLVSGSTLVF
jgi:hypothetical protein